MFTQKVDTLLRGNKINVLTNPIEGEKNRRMLENLPMTASIAKSPVNAFPLEERKSPF